MIFKLYKRTVYTQGLFSWDMLAKECIYEHKLNTQGERLGVASQKDKDIIKLKRVGLGKYIQLTFTVSVGEFRKRILENKIQLN